MYHRCQTFQIAMCVMRGIWWRRSGDMSQFQDVTLLSQAGARITADACAE